jgi:hypothetical protein
LPDPLPPYRYRPEVLDELAGVGVRPTHLTPPQRVRDFLSALYRWEIRQLRQQLLARAFPRSEYADRVIALRRRYPLLSIPVEAWVESQPPAPQGPRLPHWDGNDPHE